MKQITTYAVGKWISCREETRTDNGSVVISNEGQSTIALVPDWSEWGKTIAGTDVALESGKRYKITIEVNE